ncbi:hypothetical protein HPULCUR_002502 [Helicostylum pulchrum]|uniref:Uncharacterized protein n=1 Tax=Helicostylum pulchrum TaxID=562976 RepID=A0ABP9XSF3_9FUNG
MLDSEMTKLSEKVMKTVSDYGTPYNGFMELHHLCYEVGLLFSPGKDSSQAALTAMVLGKHLPEGDVRTSNRDDAVVSLNSSEYATYLELRMDLMIELGGVYQNIIIKFEFFNSSPKLANCALAGYRLRYNTEVGSKNRYGATHVGHHDPWLTQHLNKLKMQLGHFFRGTYHDPDGAALCYQDGQESFGACQIPLELANEYRMNPYNSTVPTTNSSTIHSSAANVEHLCTLPCLKVNKTESSAYRYLAKVQNVAFAVVPVHTTEERSLFKNILDSNPWLGAGIEPNWDEVCIVWSGYCNAGNNNIQNSGAGIHSSL